MLVGVQVLHKISNSLVGFVYQTTTRCLSAKSQETIFSILEHTNVQQLNLTEMHSTFDKIKNSSLVTITQTHPFSVHDIVCWYLFINKFTIFCISITLILSIVRSILNLLTKVFFAA